MSLHGPGLALAGQPGHGLLFRHLYTFGPFLPRKVNDLGRGSQYCPQVNSSLQRLPGPLLTVAVMQPPPFSPTPTHRGNPPPAFSNQALAFFLLLLQMIGDATASPEPHVQGKAAG